MRPSRFVGILVCALAAVLVFQVGKTAPYGNYAIGCDVFGYLRQAQLFRDNGFVRGLDTRIPNEEARFLIEAARSTGLPPTTWGEMVAPHCHHYKASTDRVSLQYPPGTGLLLSLLPADRNAALLHVFALGLTLAAFAALAASGAITSLSIALAGFAMVLVARALTAQDLMGSFSAPASIALIPVAVLCASLAFPHGLKPRILPAALLGALCGLLILVRIPNAIVVAGLGTMALVQGRLWSLPAIRSALPAVLAAAAAFALAVSPLLAANAINAGGLLATTYSPQDAAPAVFSSVVILANANYYFSQANSWPVALAALISLLAAGQAALTQASARGAFAGALVAFGLTTGYFLTHEIKAPYYLLPAAVLTLACCLIALDPEPGARPWLAPLVALPLLALVGREATLVPPSTYQFSAPVEVLRPEAVVWGDLTTGTLTYHLGKYAAKLPFASGCAQAKVMHAVAKSGRPQYLVIDSPNMAAIEARLSSAGQTEEVDRLKVHDAMRVLRLKNAAILSAPPAC